ncbi:hypothetical protein E3226_008905 [Legionella geestiana]|uniref:hypothetical protein n=1 Tax=Legionella geestiana TaxID=45065 RepID=UPI0010932445|nr:hypothetical protein [Legionella geestiana]QDQ40498.1 hypothetical protein E3226_008905 [Legionella geestiana]
MSVSLAEIKAVVDYHAVTPHLAPLRNDLAATFIKDLGRGIAVLDNAESPAQKLEALSRIRAAVDFVETRENPQRMAEADAFQNLKNALFIYTQAELEKIGVHSLHAPDKPRSPLSEIISNMSPFKANALMEILARGNSESLEQDLRALYEASDTTAEAKRFRQFLGTHAVAFLGGENSQNFTVTHQLTGARQVLKLEDRDRSPRHVERHLRDYLPNLLIPHYAERQVEGAVPLRLGDYERASRTLIATDFIHGGSALQHAEKMRNAGKGFEAAADIGLQMCDAFKNIQNAGCFFPDSKLSNWLVDASGRLIIADTKSFLFTNSYGNYTPVTPGNENLPVLQTHGFGIYGLPDDNIPAEAAHAALLGRNLYTSLTGEWPPHRDFQESDFSHPAFATERGAAFKTLIQDLTHPVPSERKSLDAARASLMTLGALPVPFLEAAARLNTLKVGENDPGVQSYLAAKEAACRNASSPEEKEAIIASMNSLYDNLKNGAFTQITGLIHQLREDGKSIFSIGSLDKAERITNALRALPLDERVNPATGTSPQAIALKEAIASHRHFWKSSPKADAEGKIDENAASSSFRSMKNQLNAMREESTPEEAPKPPASPSVR